MTYWDAIGYVASGLVVMAFGIESIVGLRTVAMISNVAFIIYGIGLELTPVWLLHATLFPMNAWRLSYALRSVNKTSREEAPDRGSKSSRAVAINTAA